MKEETKILEELGQEERAVKLIRQLSQKNKDSCICEKLGKVQIKPIKRFDILSFTFSESIIIISLLCCSMLTRAHIYQLLNIKGENQRRVVRRTLAKLKKNGFIRHDLIIQGHPFGSISIWLLTLKGYRAAMKCYLPNSPIPSNPPKIHLSELAHYCLVADIFCTTVSSGNKETTMENIRRIRWYPPHKLLRKYDPQWTAEQKNRYRHLCPDAILEDREGALRIYLEADRNTKSITQERGKLKAYKQLSSEYRHQLPILHFYEHCDIAKALQKLLKIPF